MLKKSFYNKLLIIYNVLYTINMVSHFEFHAKFLERSLVNSEKIDQWALEKNKHDPFYRKTSEKHSEKNSEEKKIIKKKREEFFMIFFYNYNSLENNF